MLPFLLSLFVLLSSCILNANVALAERGRTSTGWDCCKPACAWTQNLKKSKATGAVKVCSKDDQPLSTNQGARAQSSCSNGGGTGYLCGDYSPKPVANGLSYGFAVTNGSENCCKCFELLWTDGEGAGKRVQLQVINTGGTLENGREFVILTPGGGVGPNPSGCSNQYGDTWGRQYGGVSSRDDCADLPDNLQGGCYWRWNWANGDINGWNVSYSQIQCPDQLASISGCKNNP